MSTLSCVPLGPEETGNWPFEHFKRVSGDDKQQTDKKTNPMYKLNSTHWTVCFVYIEITEEIRFSVLDKNSILPSLFKHNHIILKNEVTSSSCCSCKLTVSRENVIILTILINNHVTGETFPFCNVSSHYLSDLYFFKAFVKITRL